MSSLDSIHHKNFLQGLSLSESAIHFSDDSQKRVQEVLNKFLNELEQEDTGNSMIQSSHGKTDVTFVCNQYSSDKLRPDKFILKLINPCLSLNVRVNSQVLTMLGFKAPKVIVWKKESEQSFKFTQLIKENLDPNICDKDLMYMNAFPGGDLGHLIESGVLFKLTQNDWNRALEFFGKLAVIDLCLANDDRFFRLPMREAFDSAEGFCNSGNVMLYIPMNEECKRYLKALFCIDNCCSSSLKRLKTMKRRKEILQRFLEAFTFFSKNENPKILADKIYQGLMLHIRPALLNRDSERETRLIFLDKINSVEHLSKGIVNGYQLLMNTDSKFLLKQLSEFLKTQESDFDSVDLCQDLLTLLNDCLDSLQKEEICI